VRRESDTHACACTWPVCKRCVLRRTCG
jgi:hypothetical protein